MVSKNSRRYAHETSAVDQAFVGPLAEAANRSPLPILVTDGLTKGHPIVFANEAFVALTGSPRGGVRARPVMEVLSERGDPATVSRIKTALDKG